VHAAPELVLAWHNLLAVCHECHEAIHEEQRTATDPPKKPGQIRKGGGPRGGLRNFLPRSRAYPPLFASLPGIPRPRFPLVSSVRLGYVLGVAIQVRHGMAH
jgi:hypothetical protein